MNSTLKRTLTIASAAMAFAVMGFADELTANIQFPFFVRGVAMPAARYTVTNLTTQGGAPMYVISNRVSHQSVAMPFMRRSPAKSTDSAQPRIVFQCGAEACWVKEVWDGSSTFLEVSGPTSKKAQASSANTHVAVVYFDTKGN